MSNMLANISGIIKSSVIDGPGNRMVIFFQACNLNCIYCHNPHTIGLCNLCGVCVDVCPTKSLQIDAENERIIHTECSCTRCDECIKSCPGNSSPFYKSLSVEELISEIHAVRDFISGITVSGGEVMLQAEFLLLLFQAIKSDPELQHLSILIDSNGNVEKHQWDSILHLVDGVMLDMKAYSKEIHQKITGHSNEKILESIEYLDARSKLKELRFVLVPSFNNDEDELGKMAQFISTLSPDVGKKLIKMRNHGIRNEYSYLKEANQEDMDMAEKIFRELDLDVQLI